MGINFSGILFFVCVLVTSFGHSATTKISREWTLGGNLTVLFKSETPFEYTQNNQVEFSAHLPGFCVNDQEVAAPNLVIEHQYIEEGDLKLTQYEGKVDIVSRWDKIFPPDFIHLLYGAARLEWIKRGIFPVHAACIGNDDEGYILVMGAPGSGKTSLTLNAVLNCRYKVFSGDKTLLRFNDDHQLEAIAGTRTITIRSEDINRWEGIPKEHEHRFVDRLAFQLLPEYYSQQAQVPIKKIVLMSLNNGVDITSQLSSMSALHTLYPFFMDKQRDDILLEGDQAFFDGAVSKEARQGLQKNLKHALEDIPVYKAVSSLEKVTGFICSEDLSKNKIKKVLLGICGISNGHCNRQLPVLTHMLEKGYEVMVFTYGDGLIFFKSRFQNEPRLTVVPVSNPYYVGTPQGLDFIQTAESESNKVDFNKTNSLAMDQASKKIGTPDLVISDYEMVAAQYAYLKDAPLVTLDQQSKYLVGEFVPLLNGTSYLDEIERLRLFFPKAKKRIAVSFFRVNKRKIESGMKVKIISPMIRSEVLAAKGTARSSSPSILVYITAQQLGERPINDWINSIRTALPPSYKAHFFLPKRFELLPDEPKLSFYHHGDNRFDSLLFAAHGIITTAGHSLLSEAMYLEKPVYALPLPLYEQQLNGHVIAQGNFGICSSCLNAQQLETFFSHLEEYRKNIHNDQKYLLKEPGNDLIIKEIDQLLTEK